MIASVVQLLIHLRYLAVMLQLLTIWWVRERLQLAIPIQPLVAISALLLLFNLVIHGVHRFGHALNGRAALFGQLAVDLLALTGLLYFSGGSGNPFVSLYLVPIAIAATALEFGPVLALSALSAVLYTWLMTHYLPLPHAHGGDFALHVSGMWINFLLSAAIMVAVLGRFMVMLKAERRRWSEIRERTLRDESLLALGALAAGTAHELNTPLTTLGLLIDDWELSGQRPQAEDFSSLREQLRRCREHVRALADLARRGATDETVVMAADSFVESCLDRLALLRPGVDVSLGGAVSAARLRVEPTLPQAIINLLNNAADAALVAGQAAEIQVELEVHGERLWIRIMDRGLGPDRPGAAVNTATQRGGLGIGLLISNASIERNGGELRHYPRPGGGSVVQVDLPLAGAE